MALPAITFNVKFKGVEDYRARLGKVGRSLMPEITKQITPICKEIMNFMADDLVSSPPYGMVATGDLDTALRNSKVIATDRNNVITIKFGATEETDVPGYAAVIEFGAKPHMPPTSKILEWMNQRGIQGGLKVAYAIALKLAAEGLPAHHFFETAYNEHLPQLQEALEKALQTVMETI